MNYQGPIIEAPDEVLLKLMKDRRCSTKQRKFFTFILKDRGVGDLKEYKYKYQ